MSDLSLARRWVRFADAHRGAVLLAGAVVGLLGAVGTGLLYADLRPDMTELLPTNARAAKDLTEISKRVGGWAEEAIVVTGADRETLKRFGDDLARELKPFEPQQIKWLEYRIDDMVDFFGKRAWLFPSLEDLKEIKSRVAARIRWEKQHANPLFVPLEDEQAPELDDLVKKYEAEKGGLLSRFPDSYFVGEAPGRNPGEKLLGLVMLVRMAGNPADFKQVLAIDDRVREKVEALKPASYSPTLKVAYGGYVASNILEHDALAEDLVVATALVFLAVALSLLLYYRTWKSIPVVGVPLMVGTAVTFGLSYLKVGHLNSNTAFLGSIVVGNGINFPIILLARYLEERRRGGAPLAAMEIAVEKTWLGTAVASLAAGVSYGSLMATEFRGFNEFGFIGLLGMAMCWTAGYALMPPLALAWEARSPLIKPGQAPARPLFTELLARLVERVPKLALGGALLVTLAAVALVARFARDPIEMDFSKLRDSRALAPEGPGWWDERVDAIFGEHLTPNVFLCRDEAEARQVHAALDVARKSDSNDYIGSVTSVASFVPLAQEEKLPVIEQIRAMATPDVLALVPPEKRAQLEKVIPPEELQLFGTKDLPYSLLRQITEVDGRVGTPVLVYPSSKVNVWDGRDVLRFSDFLRGIPMPRPDIPVASPLLIFSDVLHSISRDGPRATVLSLFGVVVFVLALFYFDERSRRSLADAAWVIGSLLVGVLWFLGLAGLMGLKLNMLNFIAVPITFGIGVDYAANVFQRKRLDRAVPIADCLRTTGGAVALCSLTTIIGYSSLLVARNQALTSFGLLADLGELACLSTALIALPALLRWRELRAEARPAAAPAVEA